MPEIYESASVVRMKPLIQAERTTLKFVLSSRNAKIPFEARRWRIGLR